MKARHGRRERTRAVGVVLPVHNEEDLLGTALVALEVSLEKIMDHRAACGVAIVLDTCSDASESLAQEWRRDAQRRLPELGVLILSCDARNVGVARGLGCAALLRNWDYLDAAGLWLATTDADSQVPRNWLAEQVKAHERGADLWTGRILVGDWTMHDSQTRERWTAVYEAESKPLHGANMGFNALRYLQVGGFPPFETGEDREFCARMMASGARLVHNSTVRVSTSARRVARAPRGFSNALKMFESEY